MFAESFFDEMEKIAVGWGGPGSSALRQAMPATASPKAISAARAGMAHGMRVGRRDYPTEARAAFRATRESRAAGHPGLDGLRKDLWREAVTNKTAGNSTPAPRPVVTSQVYAPNKAYGKKNLIEAGKPVTPWKALTNRRPIADMRASLNLPPGHMNFR